MIVCLEGISGSGKTTIINNLASFYPNSVVIEHPNVHSVIGNYARQLIKTEQYLSGGLAALSDINLSLQLAKKNPYQLFFWSRCHMSTLAYNGRFPPSGEILCEVIKNYNLACHYVFYLDIPPKLCHQRLQSRQRLGDKDITLNKLETDAYYFTKPRMLFTKQSNYRKVYQELTNPNTDDLTEYINTQINKKQDGR